MSTMQQLPVESEQRPDGKWKVSLPQVNISGVGATQEEAASRFAAALQSAMMMRPEVAAQVMDLMSAVAVPPATEIDQGDSLPKVTTAEFDEVINGDRPVLVDFWAPWCKPCLALAPYLDELQAELGDRIRIVKLNSDEETDIAAAYNVMSLPTLILFRDGEEVHRIIGAGSKESLREAIAAHV